MKINYNTRCVTDAVVDGMACQIIRYGVFAHEANKNLDFPAWRDVRSPQYDHHIEKVFVHANQKEPAFKLIVTRLVSEHTSKAEATKALRGLKPTKGALGVIIRVGKQGDLQQQQLNCNNGDSS